ncbi:hypothetical protein V1264_023795 [Littorina saxatilis]|uniref:P21-activated protein kinase-interacting protein 1-like n=2 Tax=Littorina saxatilis TaxID=31220 RepID=A0AAN9B8X3_9CAEN
MEVVVGTYEEVLVGLHLRKVDDVYTLTESFTDKSNIGSIKCVAISQHGLLASGGSDEIIHIFNLENHRLVGTLTHHSGTVTNVAFYRKSALFSTSEDGTLCAWRVGSWEHRTFKGHKGPVNCVAVHPSGKLALTVGQDRSLRTWNLVDGRPAFVSNIKEPADHVVWSPDGQHYLVVTGKRMDVYSVEDGQILRSIPTEHKVNRIVFITDNMVVFGGEGKIRRDAEEKEKAILFFVDVTDGTEVHRVKTQSTRIRDMAVCQSHEEPESTDKWLTTVASEGDINIYRVNASQKKVETDLILSRNITLRLTCVAVSSPKSQESDAAGKISRRQKRKQAAIKKEPDSDDEPSPKVVKKNPTTTVKSTPTPKPKKLQVAIEQETDSSEPNGEVSPSSSGRQLAKKKLTKKKFRVTASASSGPLLIAVREQQSMKTKSKKKKLESPPTTGTKKTQKKVRIAEPAQVESKMKSKKKKQKIKSHA